jgi:hypothetical protein
MTTDMTELQAQLKSEKAQLRTSLATISDRASEAVDWKHQVRTHPWESIAAAAVVGVIVGALTSGSSSRAPRNSAFPGSVSRRQPSPTITPEWNRLKAGIAGMVADRAIVVAQGFLDRATSKHGT